MNTERRIGSHNLFPVRKSPNAGLVPGVIRLFRNGYFASLLAATSVATLTVGAYPETREASRAEKYPGALAKVIDRIEFATTSVVLEGDGFEKTPREQLLWLLGIAGVWIANASALSHLFRKKIEQMEGDDTWRPLDTVETKFLLDKDIVVELDHMRMYLEREGFEESELVQAYCEPSGGAEMKLQHSTYKDGRSVTLLKGKRTIPTIMGHDRRSQVYETIIADDHYSRIFYTQVIAPSIANGVYTEHTKKIRWTRHNPIDNTTIHIDYYEQDEEGAHRFFLEVVKPENDTRDPMNILPDDLRQMVIGPTTRTDGRIQDTPFSTLLNNVIQNATDSEVKLRAETKRIQMLLQKAGIDTSKWTPENACKTVAQLAAESIAGESTVEIDPNTHTLQRITHVVNVYVYTKFNGQRYQLVEAEQMFHGGASRSRDLDFLAEKKLGGESAIVAFERALKEEIGFTGDVKFVVLDPETKVRDSQSYPGLPTKYCVEKAETTLPSDQVDINGYCSPSEGKTAFFEWKPVREK